MIDLVDLAHAHVTQHTTSGVKGPWVVLSNRDERTLHEFPPNIPDKLMQDILNFARKYELIALNAGIEFQKDKQNAVLHEANLALAEELKAMETHTDKLAQALDKFTRGDA